ncbi:MAG: group 1 truncated hemoglobin, partial [Proteobacteria bacterium]|nr:group 1 truncated hemoglobin [Pseudomonadota bacterium]
ISAELFDTRSELLDEALHEAGVERTLRERWMKIDGAFKGKLVKSSPQACEGRFKTDPILVFAKPGR